MRIPPLCFCSLALILSTGCATQLIRVPAPDPAMLATGAPTLEEAIDLGGLPLAALGELRTDDSDDRYTPGEYVALVGANMHGGSPRVTVGNRPAPVVGYLKGGSLLIRVPLGLSPGQHTAQVETDGGTSAAIRLPASIYAYGSDVQGDALRFRRLGPESGGFEDEVLDIPFEKALFQSLSPDGAFLYAIQKPADPNLGFGVPSEVKLGVKIVNTIKGDPVTCNLLVVHLGAKDGPQVVGTLPLTLATQPTGMAMGDGRVVVLQNRQLTVLDVSNPLQPREAAILPIADSPDERQLIDAVFLADGTRLAVLEAYANDVHFIDVQDAANPTRMDVVRLSKSVGEPFSIDLALADDGQSVWVLQGPNMRLAGKRLLDGLKAFGKNLIDLEFKESLNTAGKTAKGVAMLPQEGLCRAIQVSPGDSGATLGRSVPVPADLFPFFIQPDGKGSIYVSGINRTILDLARLELSMDGLMALLDMLKNAAQLGRVIKISTATGRRETVLKGVAIYYDLTLLPSGQLVVSVVRLGSGYIPPRVTLEWGLEVANGPFVELREIADSTTSLTDALKKLMPPYDYERIGVQR